MTIRFDCSPQQDPPPALLGLLREAALHNVVRDHRWCFDACERRLLPQLADAAGARR